MIVVMEKNCSEREIATVTSEIGKLGLRSSVSRGAQNTVVGIIGDLTKIPRDYFEKLSGVDKVLSVTAPFKRVGRDFHPDNTVIDVNGVKIGGKHFVVMAGPCTLESEEQMRLAAEGVKKAGAKILRGSTYKPRSSPYSFQGHGDEGLKLLRKIADEFNMVVETEVMDTRKVEIVSKYVDILRVGTRNMQNFDLLAEVGRAKKPVILKRGMSSTIQEFLMAAEYIMNEGNDEVILCERGIRTFETETRFTLDISCIPVVQKLSHLPIIIDPSHAAGKRYMVPALSKAALAAGADGLIIEVHPEPDKAVCDGPQQLNIGQFGNLMADLRKIGEATGREMHR